MKMDAESNPIVRVSMTFNEKFISIVLTSVFQGIFVSICHGCNSTYIELLIQKNQKP